MNYKRMYYTLFNTLTDALGLLEDGQPFKAANVLRQAQAEAEEIFLQGDTEVIPAAFAESQQPAAPAGTPAPDSLPSHGQSGPESYRGKNAGK